MLGGTCSLGLFLGWTMTWATSTGHPHHTSSCQLQVADNKGGHCQFPFTLPDSDTTYHSCLKVSGSRYAQCPPVAQVGDGYDLGREWRDCGRGCPSTRPTRPICRTRGTRREGRPCIFPFSYRGRSYEGCVRRGLLGLGILGGVGDAMCPWRLNRDGSFEWEKCSSDCRVVGDNQGHGHGHDDDHSAAAAQYCTVSGPDPGKRCVFPFRWRGVLYNDCTAVDHDKAWCPTKIHADGQLHDDDNDWGNCGRCY